MDPQVTEEALNYVNLTAIFILIVLIISIFYNALKLANVSPVNKHLYPYWPKVWQDRIMSRTIACCMLIAWLVLMT